MEPKARVEPRQGWSPRVEPKDGAKDRDASFTVLDSCFKISGTKNKHRHTCARMRTHVHTRAHSHTQLVLPICVARIDGTTSLQTQTDH